MTEEISPEVMQKLEEAQAHLAHQTTIEGPPIEEKDLVQGKVGKTFEQAGSGAAKHILIDHYFTSSLRRLWVYSDNAWRNRVINDEDLKGIVKTIFKAKSMQIWWDANNQITLIRCRK
ncbi:MAG: hypothetical protein ACQEQH_01845 [Bacillota bacterium]